jgi:signal peptidase I
MSDEVVRSTVIEDEGADATSELPVPAATARRRRTNPIIEWLIVVVVAISSALLVRAFVVQQFAVDGHSMDTTLHNGDRVLVNKLSYRLHDPNRGDVVVLKTLEGVGERDLIKRVIGLPGDTIAYQDCTLTIDGRQLIEPYLDPAIVRPPNCGPDLAPTVVLPDHVFVMGDNRGGSKDSRDPAVGQVPYGNLLGRAFVVIWPVGDWAWL